jgi:CHAD domain-containing protein
MTLSLEQAVARCQTILAHAWMVRTFVKHSPEVEDFPELMEIVRNVFDLSRALETQVDDPPKYLHMLRKKIAKLRKAAEKFRHDAPLASTHTNFQQAVLSMDACVVALDEVLAQTASPAPASPGVEDEEDQAE